MALEIERFEPKTAGEDEFRARHAFVVEIDRELEPERAPVPYDTWRKAYDQVPEWSSPRLWSVWAEDRSRLVAAGRLALDYLETNRHMAFFSISVAADHRRQKLGTHLLAAVAEESRADDRTILTTGAWSDTCGIQFLEAMGGEARATERLSELDVASVDRDLVRTWIERATERGSDYELLQWDTRTPDEHLERFVDLTLVMNTAPRDDLEMDDWTSTPERHRFYEDRAIEQGYTGWTFVARKRSTGEFAGYTELGFVPHEPGVGWQGATAVHPDHRNQGLGRWLKAAMLQRVFDERADLKTVITGNAYSNDPMLAINNQLGFVEKRGNTTFQFATEDLVATLKQRLGS